MGLKPCLHAGDNVVLPVSLHMLEHGRLGSLPWFSRPELESCAAVTSGGAGEVASSLRGLALAQEIMAEVT